MSSARIVIIEQERESADRAAARLRSEGYEVELVSAEQEEWPKVQAFSPDLVLLDATSAGGSAGQIVKRLRKSHRTARTPILLMTFHGKDGDTILGLNAGADDFILKPLNPAELSARAAALLHRLGRRRTGPEHTFQIGPISINLDRHEVTVDGEPLNLTLTEFRLLSSLAEAGGRVLKRNLLIDQAIGMDAIVTDRTIDVHLTGLRRKLGRARRCLKTVRGVGYRLTGDKTAAR